MPPVLCLDFGSAYTKVALRRDREEPSILVEEPTLNFDPLHVCIPTVVAVAQRSGSSRWKCGLDVVGVSDAPGTKVYRNWKKHLFLPDAPSLTVTDADQDSETDFLEDLEAAARERKRLIRLIARAKKLEVEDVSAIATRKRLTLEKLRATFRQLRPEQTEPIGKANISGVAAGVTTPEIREVALAFFKWLQGFVEKACEKHGVADVLKIPVRVCVPAFGGEDQGTTPTPGEELLLAILEESGWKLDKDRSTITEPFANSIGTLSGGLNRTWIPNRSGGNRFINMGEMFSHRGLIEAYRNRTLKGPATSSEHVILVIDVGAYTSDFALLEFDISDSEAPPWIGSHSEPIAVDVLDQEVLALFPGPKKDAVVGLELKEREEMKSGSSD